MIEYEFAILRTILDQSGCDKKQVAAGCYVDGFFTTRTNSCGHGGLVCPRIEMKSGEGYELCDAYHAEQKLANEVISKIDKTYFDIPEIVWVYGHYYACEPCARALKELGVEEIRIREL